MWALTRHESIGGLVVDVFELNGHNLGYNAIKRVLVGGPLCFEKIETSYTGVGKYLYPSYFVYMLSLMIFSMS